MVMGPNDPEPGDLGAGSLLYKGHMIPMQGFSLEETINKPQCWAHAKVPSSNTKQV